MPLSKAGKKIKAKLEKQYLLRYGKQGGDPWNEQDEGLCRWWHGKVYKQTQHWHQAM